FVLHDLLQVLARMLQRSLRGFCSPRRLVRSRHRFPRLRQRALGDSRFPRELPFDLSALTLDLSRPPSSGLNLRRGAFGLLARGIQGASSFSDGSLRRSDPLLSLLLVALRGEVWLLPATRTFARGIGARRRLRDAIRGSARVARQAPRESLEAGRLQV